MDEREFIKQATSRIYSLKKKQLVASELHDHIESRAEWYRDAGYDEAAALQKSVDAMGDAEEIAKTLGELHRAYNPAADLILLAVCAAALAAAYFAEERFVFGDPGAITLLLCGVFFGAAVFMLYAAYAAHKRHIVPALLTLAAGAAGGAYIYFISDELSRLVDGSAGRLAELIAQNGVYYDAAQDTHKLMLLITAVFGSAALLCCACLAVPALRRETVSGTARDGAFSSALTRVFSALAVLSVAAAAGFGALTASRIERVQGDYKEAFELVVNLEQQCQTKEQAIEFLKSSGRDFHFRSEDKANPNEITSAYLNGGIFSISVSFPDTEEDEEEASQLFGGDESYVYSAYLSVSNTEFARSWSSLTLRGLVPSEEEIEELYSLKPYEMTGRDYYKALRQHLPISITAEKRAQRMTDSSVRLVFLDTLGGMNDMHYFDIKTETDERLDILQRQKKIAEQLGSTDSSNPQEIARLTGTQPVYPDFTEEEYLEVIHRFICGDNAVWDYAPALKQEILGMYDSFVEYSMGDNWYFTLFRLSGDENDMVRFEYRDKDEYSLGDLLSGDYEVYSTVFVLTDSGYQFVADETEPYKKVYYAGGAFDAHGNFYTDEMKLRYYGADGEVYKAYSADKTDEDGEKRYRFIDSSGRTYAYESCYIDANGCFVAQESGEIADAGTRPFEASWNEKGKLIDFDDYAQ